MNVYYNPLDKVCKSVTGGIKRNEDLVINVLGDGDEPCLFVFFKDGGEAQYLHMKKCGRCWTVTLNFSETGLYFYYFIIGGSKAGAGKFRDLAFSEQISCYQIVVYAEEFSTPDWFKGGVMYQIFPDRFCRGKDIPIGKGKWLHTKWDEAPEYRMNAQGKILNNDFFGGNFDGITGKLDYLASLGVTAVYLNPIFKAFSNHRYDTGDYMQIDPLLGSDADFDNFITECERRKIRVILDGVFNHTGDDSRYFNKYGNYDELGAYQSRDSKYYAWYNFKHFPDKYESWWGIDVLPSVNESCESYSQFITGENGVIDHWMRRGVSGFRLDVADELPDDFIEKIRKAARNVKSDALIIGEVWEDASNKIAYSKRRKYLQGKELDSVMDYPLKDAIIDFVKTGKTASLRETIAMLSDNYPKCVLDSLMNILGTHDTARILTVLGGIPANNKDEMNKISLSDTARKRAKHLLKIAAILQFTLFGVPCVYYGDEIGMEGYGDPFCRHTFDWDKQDNELLEFYKKLGRLRQRAFGLFRDSEYREIFADDKCLVYERAKGVEQVIVAVNMGSDIFDIKYNGRMFDFLSGECYENVFTINPLTATILTDFKP